MYSQPMYKPHSASPNYIHFGPWSLRSSVISVPFLRTEITEDRSDRGPKWPRHFGPKDRSVHQRTDLHVSASASVRRGGDCGDEGDMSPEYSNMGDDMLHAPPKLSL